MARRSDPARIYQARRAAVESNLTGSGMPRDDAERWLAAWEAETTHDPRDRDYWQAGEEWIAGRRRR